MAGMLDPMPRQVFGRAVADQFPPLPPIPPPRGPAVAARAPFSVQTIGADAAPDNDGSSNSDDYVVVTMTTATDGAVIPTTMPDTMPPPQPAQPPRPPQPPAPPPSSPPPPDAVGAMKGHADEDPDGHVVVSNGECRLMGPFALFVQLGLGALALLSLVYKRWRERPQRPVKIWFFDASKQVFGSVLVHMSNVFLSLLTSGRFSFKLEPGVVASSTEALVRMAVRTVRRDDVDGGGEEPYMPNPCSFYLLNLAIDTTVGIPILIGLLRLTTAIVAYTPLGKPRESIQSGNYGHPPSAWWWFKQSILYFCGLFGMKICVLIIFLALPWISHVGDWALSWTEGNEQVQIVFVMMLFPLIMNAMQYYIIDGFIKEQQPLPLDGEHNRHSHNQYQHQQHHRHHHHHHHQHLHDGRYDALSDSADDEDDSSARIRHRRLRRDDGGAVVVDGGADGDDESSSGDQREEEDDEELDMLGNSDEAVGGKRLAAATSASSAVSSKVHVTIATTPATDADSVHYEPHFDGGTRPAIGSNSSQRQNLGGAAAKEL